MASTTAAALKGALVVAVCMVLLPSAMGQYFNCSICTPSCYENCRAIEASDYSKCSNVSQDSYAACFNSCSSQCKGNTDKALASCEFRSCSADYCGKKPCEHSCCEICTNAAGTAAQQCTTTAGRVMQYCMPSCMNGCSQYCTSPPAPVPASAPAPTP